MPQKAHVVCKTQHNFGCSVPSSSDVLRHESLATSGLGSTAIRAVASSQTKIADLEFAVGVDEEIPRLEITVENVGGVDVLEPAEGLI
jgi:hypothetical protein